MVTAAKTSNRIKDNNYKMYQPVKVPKQQNSPQFRTLQRENTWGGAYVISVAVLELHL
jgi:hypothetical protein